MRIAVIGSGISGNAAAWALTQPMGNMPLGEIVMYERRGRAGGHSCTIDVDYDGKSIPVDVGFIVYNELNYPNLVALFKHLGVETIESDMSFGASMKNGALEWSGKSIDTIFAQRKNLISPSHWQMIKDVLRFNKIAPQALANGELDGLSLRDYLNKENFSQSFIDNYLAPMGAAIWSTPHMDILDFPALNYITFFNNHRLMHKKAERPKWRTVSGGSRSYVSKIIAPFQEHIRYDSEVVRVERKAGQLHVWDKEGNEDVFDHVIFASHTDQTLATLVDADERERQILSAVEYRDNIVYLHRDPSLMPKRQKIWSAWNYMETSDTLQKKTGVCVSYYMNALQKIDPKTPLFVSLNPARPPRDDLTFATQTFAHPQFNHAALKAQQELKNIQGKDNIWYCGAWCGYGFHEDGLKAGLHVAEQLGAQVPWRRPTAVGAPKREAAE